MLRAAESGDFCFGRALRRYESRMEKYERIVTGADGSCCVKTYSASVARDPGNPVKMNESAAAGLLLLLLFHQLNFGVYFDLVAHHYAAGLCDGIPCEPEFFSA